MKGLLKSFENFDINSLIRFGITICITYIVYKIVDKAFKNSKRSNLIHVKFLRNIVLALTVITGVVISTSNITALNRFSRTLLAGSGIVAAVIGLAAQESFANVFSGLFISIFKPFDIGDRIRIIGDDTAGYVEDITLRHTVIRTYTNVHIIVPNSIIGKAKIENSTYEKGVSYPIEVVIAYENEEKRMKAIEIIEDTVRNHPKFFDCRTEEQIRNNEKPVVVTCNEFRENGILLKTLMWTEDVGDNIQACSDCRLEILRRFEKDGIEIPYNKLDIVSHIK